MIDRPNWDTVRALFDVWSNKHEDLVCGELVDGSGFALGLHEAGRWYLVFFVGRHNADVRFYTCFNTRCEIRLGGAQAWLEVVPYPGSASSDRIRRLAETVHHGRWGGLRTLPEIAVMLSNVMHAIGLSI